MSIFMYFDVESRNSVRPTDRERAPSVRPRTDPEKLSASIELASPAMIFQIAGAQALPQGRRPVRVPGPARGAAPRDAQASEGVAAFDVGDEGE